MNLFDVFSKKVDKESKEFNALFGFAVGNVIGADYEGISREQMHHYANMYLNGKSRTGETPVEWSHDVDQLLITLDSIENREFDVLKWRALTREWLIEGNNRKVVSNRHTADYEILKAAEANSWSGDAYSERNGALVRVLPIALLMKNQPIEVRAAAFKEVVNQTHSHPAQELAAVVYGELVVSLANGVEKAEAFTQMSEVVNGRLDSDLLVYSEFKETLNQSYLGIDSSSIPSGDHVLESLKATLWAFVNGYDFRSCLVLALSLGGDTDTILALLGALAAMVYGYRSIPEEWYSANPLLKGLERTIAAF